MRRDEHGGGCGCSMSIHAEILLFNSTYIENNIGFL